MANATLNWYSTAIEALRGANLTGKTALVTGGDKPVLVHSRAARTCVLCVLCLHTTCVCVCARVCTCLQTHLVCVYKHMHIYNTIMK